MNAYQRGLLGHMRTQAIASAKTWRAFAVPGHWGNGIRSPEECERLASQEGARAAECAALLESGS